MTKLGWVLVAVACMAAAQGTQQPQTGKPPAVSVKTVPHNDNRNLATAPTDIDMYCSGYITTDRVPESRYIVGGQNSFDQSRFAGGTDRVFIYGTGLKEGDRYEIVRRVRDPDRYEAFHAQKAAIRAAGQPYFERGIVRIVHAERKVSVAVPEVNCGDLMPGDLAIPFAEREKPAFRSVSLERYTPPTGKTTGRIIMANEFDLLLGSKQQIYVNIGNDKGVKVGDYLRITRTYQDKRNDAENGLSAKAAIYDDTQQKPPKMPRGGERDWPRLTLGDAIVLHVHPRSATAMIMTAFEDIRVGDRVEMMDVSDAPPVAAAPAPAQPEAAAPPANAASNPPSITCSASPATVRAGESANISCEVVSPDNRPVSVRFSSNTGKLNPNGTRATLDTTEAGPGPINVRATALDDRDLSASAVTSVNVEAAPAAAPTPSKISDLQFQPNSARVDNRDKAMLDDVAMRMQRDPQSSLLLKGATEGSETPKLAGQRAANAMGYLVESKGIDKSRIAVDSSAQKARTVEVWLVPAGASMPEKQ